MTEIWKDVEEYEGLYEVSNLGRIRNAKTLSIKSQNDNGRGYLQVNLWKNNKGQMKYIHRLVAAAFISNPDNLPQVNHKDEDKTNNRVDNLEWFDNSYNNNYGTKCKRQSESYLNNGKNCHKVAKCDMDGNVIEIYRSMREAERKNNMGNGVLSAYFRLDQSQCNGFTWQKL